MIDTTAEHSALQPENAIVIKPWEGKGGERGLVDLIPFLECKPKPPLTLTRHPIIKSSNHPVTCSFSSEAGTGPGADKQNSDRYIRTPRCPTYPESVRGQRYPNGICKEGSRIQKGFYRRMGAQEPQSGQWGQCERWIPRRDVWECHPCTLSSPAPVTSWVAHGLLEFLRWAGEWWKNR